MKLIIVLFAIVAAVSAYPGYEGWQDPWRSNNAWQDPWKSSSAWQNPWQNAWNPWQQSQHHEPEHHHVIQVQQPHPIPPLHPKPLHLKVHSEAQKIHYDHAKIPHPHLIGYEVYHEPKVDIKPVHSHHSGWN